MIIVAVKHGNHEKEKLLKLESYFSVLLALTIIGVLQAHGQEEEAVGGCRLGPSSSEDCASRGRERMAIVAPVLRETCRRVIDYL